MVRQALSEHMLNLQQLSRIVKTEHLGRIRDRQHPCATT